MTLKRQKLMGINVIVSNDTILGQHYIHPENYRRLDNKRST